MNLLNYETHIKEVICNTDVKSGSIFNPEFSPLVDDYLQTYSFYQEALVHNNDFGIEPAYLYFKNDFSLNAAAKRTPNNVYLVSINMGTVDWLVRRLKNNTALIEDTNINLFRILSPYLDNPINILFYQACCHYTFYHEMGHLVQNSNFLNDSVEENPVFNSRFNFDRHLLEIDADTFSALCLGTHIFQYCERLFGANFTRERLQGLVVLFSISIFMYLLSFSGNTERFYLKESTHPHPALRLTNFLMVLTKYCNDSLEDRESGFTVNQGDMFIFAMEIAEELQGYFFNASVVSNYRQTMIENHSQAVEYLSELVEANSKLQTTAAHKWNLRHAQI
nr:hypothetical protein [Allomuricauda sp.]